MRGAFFTLTWYSIGMRHERQALDRANWIDDDKSTSFYLSLSHLMPLTCNAHSSRLSLGNAAAATFACREEEDPARSLSRDTNETSLYLLLRFELDLSAKQVRATIITVIARLSFAHSTSGLHRIALQISAPTFMPTCTPANMARSNTGCSRIARTKFSSLSVL